MWQPWIISMSLWVGVNEERMEITSHWCIIHEWLPPTVCSLSDFCIIQGSFQSLFYNLVEILSCGSVHIFIARPFLFVFCEKSHCGLYSIESLSAASAERRRNSEFAAAAVVHWQSDQLLLLPSAPVEIKRQGKWRWDGLCHARLHCLMPKRGVELTCCCPDWSKNWQHRGFKLVETQMEIGYKNPVDSN